MNPKIHMNMSNYKLTEEEKEEFLKLLKEHNDIATANQALMHEATAEEWVLSHELKVSLMKKIIDNRLVRTDKKQPGGRTWRPSEREFNPFQGSNIEAFVDETGTITLKKVFNGIGFITPAGQVMGVCMRDGGFEINFGGQWYRANEGKIEPLNQEESNFADYISTSYNPDPVWISKEQDQHIKVAGKIIIALKHEAGVLNRQEIGNWRRMIGENELHSFTQLVAPFHASLGEYLDDDQINELVEAPEEELRNKYQGEAFDNLYGAMKAYAEML